MSVRVLGLDGVKERWVAVELLDGLFSRAFVVDQLGQLRSREAEWIGVDVPIGLSSTGFRAADLAARSMVGPRRSSVFLTPPRPVLDAPNFNSALVRSRELGFGGVSRQAFALFPKILDAENAPHPIRGSSRSTPRCRSPS